MTDLYYVGGASRLTRKSCQPRSGEAVYRDMRRILIVSAVLAAFVALPSIASAQGSPEAGIGEYQENVPGAGGNQPGQGGSGGGGQGGSGGAGDGGGSGGGTVTDQGLPADVVEQFAQQGADGAAAADLAQSNSPSQGGEGGQSGGGHQGDEGSQIGSGGGQNGVRGVIEKVVGANSSSDSDGMGVALPLILGASAVGALLLVLLRRRGLGPGNA
jgi:hypothetical protein